MTGDEAVPSDRTLSWAKYTLAILASAWFVAYLDRAVISLLATGIKQSLHISDVQLGFLQGYAFAGVYILVALPGGWLADRISRRNILLFGVICWSLATVACGFAANFHELAVARMFVGFGEACLAPASVSLLADYFARNARGRAIGVLTGAATVGTAGSTLLGGLVLKMLGGAPVALPLIGLAQPWQVTFMAMGAPGFLVALLLLLTVREPHRRQEKVQALPSGSDQMSFVQYFASRWPLFLAIYGTFVFSTFSGFGGQAWMPTVAIRTYGLEAGYVGLVMGSIGLTLGTITPVLVGMLSDWAGMKKPGTGRLWLIVVLFCVQLPLTAAWAFLPVSFPLFLALTALNGVASGGLSSCAYIILQELMPNHLRAQAVALFTTLGSFVGMGGGPLVVAMVTAYLFRDEMSIGYAVATVGLTCSSCGLLCMLSALGQLNRDAGGAGVPAGQAA